MQKVGSTTGRLTAGNAYTNTTHSSLEHATSNQLQSLTQSTPPGLFSKERVQLRASAWEVPRIWVYYLSVHMRRVIAGSCPSTFAGFVRLMAALL